MREQDPALLLHYVFAIPPRGRNPTSSHSEHPELRRLRAYSLATTFALPRIRGFTANHRVMTM